MSTNKKTHKNTYVQLPETLNQNTKPLNSTEIESLVAEEDRLLDALRVRNISPQQYKIQEKLSVGLLESLFTKDQEVISSMLITNDQQIIKNIVEGLTISKVGSLLESIQEAIQSKPINSHFYLKWLKQLLRVHTTTILSKSNLITLNNIKDILSARTINIQEVSKLKGKLSIVVEQNKNTKKSSQKNKKNDEIEQNMQVEI